ncbi:histidine phosphatase family protein [Baekduia sp. Peel2402]|uniref:histidine phosphatase family protein n=1 Tax=Baekduia sp. Peel2402 TaxID=3458296 RepID=UPI00403EB88F
MPETVVHVVAFRHGETTLNAEGLLTGQLDPPLTARGREQAWALAEVVARGGFDRVVHSGLARAQETLRLAGGDGLTVDAVVDERWRERSFGALEGKPRTAWSQPPDLDAAPPGGESFRALGLRIVAALDDLAAGAAQRVLVSTHSGVLRWLTAIAAGDADLEHFTRPGAANGAVVELDYAAPSTSIPLLTR